MNVSRLMKENVSRLNELIMNIKFPFLVISFILLNMILMWPNRPGVEAWKVNNITYCVLLTVKLS